MFLLLLGCSASDPLSLVVHKVRGCHAAHPVILNLASALARAPRQSQRPSIIHSALPPALTPGHAVRPQRYAIALGVSDQTSAMACIISFLSYRGRHREYETHAVS